MHKLSCKVSKSLSEQISRIGIDRDMKKGKTLEYLVRLAIENPTHEKEEFGYDESVSCTLQLGEKLYIETKHYRLLHALDTKVSFFKDALERGASIHAQSGGGSYNRGDDYG